MKNDTLQIYGENIDSRMLLGTALYPSPKIMVEAIKKSKTRIITLSLKREMAEKNDGQDFWDIIKTTNTKILPNTAGCKTVKEAVMTAHMARELFKTDWIKLEIIDDDENLQPDLVALVEAAQILIKDGFKILPYCTEDISVAKRLVHSGCQVIMPWAAPIGTGQGILNPYAIKRLRKTLSDITLIIDAGIGKPSHAAQAMEMGCDGVLINSAVARADVPQKMAEAFRDAIIAGRNAFKAGPMPKRNTPAYSTPPIDRPFWHIG